MRDDGHAFWVGMAVGTALGLALGSALTSTAGRPLLTWCRRLVARLFGGGPGVRFDLLLQ